MTTTPKFKIGDRVVIVAPHEWPEFAPHEWPDHGRAGDVGTVKSIDRDGDLWIDGVGDPHVIGERGVCYAASRVRHADPKRVMIVDSIGASVVALVEHLDAAASEHLVALDGLRKENEGLRIVAHNLRTQHDEDVARINALEAELARLQHLVDESRKVHEANAREVDDKPVREVVRGTYEGRLAMCEPGKDPEKDEGRSALLYGSEWFIYDGVIPRTPNGRALTEPKAIAWVLDGVLPDKP